MNRIDERTVELTEAEAVIQDKFEDYLDRGLGIPLSAKFALNRARRETGEFASDEFAEYISDDTVVRRGGRWHVKPGWQS